MTNPATIEIIDTHAHLDDPRFEGDLPELIERARLVGVSRVITLGTTLTSSQAAVRLAERFPAVYAAVGWHPGHVTEAPADVRAPLLELAQHPKVVAIGECGLDHHYLPSQTDGGTPADDAAIKARQAVLFRQQLEVATAAGLNIVVHERDCFREVIDEVRPFAGRLRAVFHCFAGDLARLQEVLDLGYLVSFTGVITFKNSQMVRDTLAAVPADRFMLETDSPYLAPVPHRGKRCEPAFVRATAEAAAAVRRVSLEEIGTATLVTAEAFFPKLRRLTATGAPPLPVPAP